MLECQKSGKERSLEQEKKCLGLCPECYNQIFTPG